MKFVHGEPCRYRDENGEKHVVIFVSRTFEEDGYAWVVMWTVDEGQQVVVVPER